MLAVCTYCYCYSATLAGAVAVQPRDRDIDRISHDNRFVDSEMLPDDITVPDKAAAVVNFSKDISLCSVHLELPPRRTLHSYSTAHAFTPQSTYSLSSPRHGNRLNKDAFPVIASEAYNLKRAPSTVSTAPTWQCSKTLNSCEMDHQLAQRRQSFYWPCT